METTKRTKEKFVRNVKYYKGKAEKVNATSVTDGTISISTGNTYIIGFLGKGEGEKVVGKYFEEKWMRNF